MQSPACGRACSKTVVRAPSRLCLPQPAHACTDAGRAPARRCAARAATGADGSARPADHPAVLLEADAAVLDLHVDGHRVAFNRAFDVRR